MAKKKKKKIPHASIPAAKVRAEANYFGDTGQLMNREMREAVHMGLEDMGTMYKAGAALKAEGMEQPHINIFMQVFGFPSDMGEEMPHDLYMQFVQMMYSAFEDGYRGEKR